MRSIIAAVVVAIQFISFDLSAHELTGIIQEIMSGGRPISTLTINFEDMSDGRDRVAAGISGDGSVWTTRSCAMGEGCKLPRAGCNGVKHQGMLAAEDIYGILRAILDGNIAAMESSKESEPCEDMSRLTIKVRGEPTFTLKINGRQIDPSSEFSKFRNRCLSIADRLMPASSY